MLNREEEQEVLTMLKVITNCVDKQIYNDRLELTGALKDVIKYIWREGD